jgi:hypothetical protein
MVFIMDEGNEFDATLDRVWKLNQAHSTKLHKLEQKDLNFKGK